MSALSILIYLILLKISRSISKNTVQKNEMKRTVKNLLGEENSTTDFREAFLEDMLAWLLENRKTVTMGDLCIRKT